MFNPFSTLSLAQKENLKAYLSIAMLLTLLVSVGSVVAGALGIYVSLATSFSLSLLTMWYCKELVVWLMNAKQCTPGKVQHNFDLAQMVIDLSKEIATNLTTPPDVYVVESESINAFATGRNQTHSAVFLTTGLLKKVREKAENVDTAENWIRAILSHELGHIVHQDVRLHTMISMMVASVRILSEYCFKQRRNAQKTSTRNNQKHQRPVVNFLWLCAEFLFFYCIVPLSATLLGLFVSRAREYAADQHAVKCYRGQDLKSVFEQLFQEDTDTTMLSKDDRLSAFSGMMCTSLNPQKEQKIANALKQKDIGWFSWTCKQWEALHATHPPIKDRIQKIEESLEKKKSNNLRS